MQLHQFYAGQLLDAIKNKIIIKIFFNCGQKNIFFKMVDVDFTIITC
jgi:hypothetical protein